MFKTITLELSLKPFKNTSEPYIRRICTQVFQQWRPLIKDRETISVMLWVGDGSEILDYAGKPEDEFEWARFIGRANLPTLSKEDPEYMSLHKYKQDYIPNAPKMTYGILKKIVLILKEEGRKAFPEAAIRVGTTFDIGPEFAISDFRYNRHPEICVGSTVEGDEGVHKLVDATAILHGDNRYYAAYPQGIPSQTPFGTFLGKQSEIFLKDMELDFLWLSNGLGFSSDPWKRTGKIFDGNDYYPEKLPDIREKVFNFWKLFRKECSYPLETRGTNNTVGIDYASDGVPLYDIYNAGLDITAPPNSPWAALNDNYGLELMGHMTRICELPNECFPFRYYIHDPWWMNSPWYDRYDGSPCDIYLPMAISRIDEKGITGSANSLHILSIDNSYGQMPDSCANEPIPHILKAEKDAPDEAAPLVLVYPMREYTTSKDGDLLKEMNICDNYICNAINDGFPLCCVVSTDNFLKHSISVYGKSILLSPVPENPAVLDKLTEYALSGIPVMIYGTEKKLETIKSHNHFVKINAEGDPGTPREFLSQFGYNISFEKKVAGTKPPTMAIARHDNGLFFSVYNANTTTAVRLRFPFGAPILCGMETEIIDGSSRYHFNRGEHRECRIYIHQSRGVISCREAPPINTYYRRAIKISGLKDATLCLFPEKGCQGAVSVAANTDETPIFDTRFTATEDKIYGTYLKGEHLNGDIYFLMERKK